jgi:hypothetical protein
MTETTAEYTAPERYTILSNEEPAETTEVEQIPASEEAAAVESEPEVESEVEQTPEQRKKDAQNRIRQLANEKRELANENRELKERIAAQESAKSQPIQGEPNPDNYPGGTYNDNYRNDLRKYAKAEALAEVQAEHHQKTIEAEKQKVIKREIEFEQSHPGYSDAVKYFMDAGIADGGVADALIELENGLDIVYQIGTDPDLFDEFEAMTPAQRLMRIGMMSAQNSTAPTQKTARISQAAKPITPVSGGKTVLTGQAAIDAALKHNANGHIDYDAYKAAVKAAKQ